jgi:hypothetical protein
LVDHATTPRVPVIRPSGTFSPTVELFALTGVECGGEGEESRSGVGPTRRIS